MTRASDDGLTPLTTANRMNQRNPAAARLTAAALVAAASVTASFLVCDLPSGDPNPVRLWAILPALLAAWSYLTCAGRLRPRRQYVIVIVAGGWQLGSIIATFPAWLFYHATGHWCLRPLGSLSEAIPIAIRVVMGVSPMQLIAVILVSGLLVRVKRISYATVGSLAVGIGYGSLEAAVVGQSLGSCKGIQTILAYAALYGLFVPLLQWFAEILSPSASPTARYRVGIVCTWVLPPFTMLLGGLLSPVTWLQPSYPKGLMPTLPLGDLFRSIAYGQPGLSMFEHSLLCVIATLVAIGLCMRGWWTWLPWAVWFVHDLLCALAAGWGTLMVLQNIRIPVAEQAEAPWCLMTWPVFTLLISLTLIYTLRTGCVTQRGVRPEG